MHKKQLHLVKTWWSRLRNLFYVKLS